MGFILHPLHSSVKCAKTNVILPESMKFLSLNIFFYNKCFFEIVLGFGIASVTLLYGVIKHLTKQLSEEGLQSVHQGGEAIATRVRQLVTLRP